MSGGTSSEKKTLFGPFKQLLLGGQSPPRPPQKAGGGSPPRPPQIWLGVKPPQTPPDGKKNFGGRGEIEQDFGENFGFWRKFWLWFYVCAEYRRSRTKFAKCALSSAHNTTGFAGKHKLKRKPKRKGGSNQGASRPRFRCFGFC